MSIGIIPTDIYFVFLVPIIQRELRDFKMSHIYIERQIMFVGPCCTARFIWLEFNCPILYAFSLANVGHTGEKRRLNRVSSGLFYSKTICL